MITFVFLLNVLFRDLGRLLGKGLPTGVILEFFILNLAWILALAVPMSVLVATLMAFGRLSSDNEISALRAGGVHLYRLILPVLIVAGFLTVGMERFNNGVLPDANHRFRLLYLDISKKRPTLTLESNVFFDEIPNYSLLVHNVKEKENILEGIIIDDRSDPKINKTIIAEKGKLFFSPEREKLVLNLFNGEVHQVEQGNPENYRRVKFERQDLFISVSNMELERSNSEHRGEREKSAGMMREDIRKYMEDIHNREDRIRDIVRKDMDGTFSENVGMGSIDEKEEESYRLKFSSEKEKYHNIQNLYQRIDGDVRAIQGYQRAISALKVEIQKKYSIPVACIIFVLIGAPLGIMTRQGGLAVGGGMGLVFFLIYWTFLIGGEQLADRRIVGPAVAMWTPNVLVGIGGIYLVLRSFRETTFIHWEHMGRRFRRWVLRRKS